MKEYKYLYKKMLDKDLIRLAYKKLRKGKTKRIEIQEIDANLDEEVEKMYQMILNTRPCEVEHPELHFTPKKKAPKYIFEHGKTRTIYMPEIHEQWLHHIIVLVLEPIITATAYPYSCGSFPKKGAHYGKRKLERMIRKGVEIKYFGKVDIRHFYNNIRIDILMRELRIRIRDNWFLYVIRVALNEFKKGIPLGYYISQWLANYLLEPLDQLMRFKLKIKIYFRYMDDIVFFKSNKKTLHEVIRIIRGFLGRRFRLKLKRNYQISKFDYIKKNGKRIGKVLDFMGFLFFRNRTTIRKNIMLTSIRMARRLAKKKEQGCRFFDRFVHAMLSYIGWFDCTNSYRCYEEFIKPCVEIRKLKNIVSKLDRRKNHENLGKGILLRAA